MAGGLRPSYGSDGVRYYTMSYKVFLEFGLTVIRAEIGWVENVGRMLPAQSLVLINPP